MPHYIVLSPMYWTASGSEYPPIAPPEEGRDVAFVANAMSAQEAKWVAAGLWLRKNRRSWPQEQRSVGLHPLSGVTVERVDEIEDPDAWYPWFIDLEATR